MPLVGVPQVVKDAFDAGNRIFTMVRIDLKATLGGTVRWTDSPANLVWPAVGQPGSATWNSINPLKGIDDTHQDPGEEGTLAIVLTDEGRGWFQRLNQNGPRGRSVQVHWLIGLTEAHAGSFVYQFAGFDGTTQAARFVHDDGGFPETRLIVMDKLYYTYHDNAEMTSNAYQRSLDTSDNSHVIAHQARKTVWHRG